MFGSTTTTSIISNEEMSETSLEECGVLRKCISETIKIEAKEEKGGFLRMLLGTLGVILLGNLLTVKGTISAASSFNKF